MIERVIIEHAGFDVNFMENGTPVEWVSALEPPLYQCKGM